MSNKIPKIFVGTLCCGEGDYSECLSSLFKQKSVIIEHVVISNKPEKDAHNCLWKEWRSVQHGDFDMFVKLDADTVLAHEDVLFEFWKMMSSNTRITGIQAPLLDYFTDGYINGLNCFSPKVTFCDATDELFCDRQVDVNHDIVIKSDEVVEKLRPAGFHCYRATEIQSFHFGVHRALKNQVHILEFVKKAWKRNNDRRRAFALLGAWCASSFRDGGFNYNDQRLKCAFDSVVRRYDELIKNIS